MNPTPNISSRPPTSGKNALQSAVRQPTGSNQGPSSVQGRTGSSAGPSVLGRPGSRSIWTSHQGINLNPSISVLDRPMTQHGLGGVKTSWKPSQRVVQDKTYFMGLLRSKINDLSREIGTLSKESEGLSREKSAHKSYDQKASQLALDIKMLQEDLMAYNMVIDKMNTNSEIEDVRREQQQLKQQNDQLSVLVDDLFVTRQRKAEDVAKKEAELKEAMKQDKKLITNMSPDLKEKYLSLEHQNKMLQQQIETMQEEIADLEKKKVKFESDIGTSAIKQEAIGLYEKIRELEEQQEALLEEERVRGSPAQEREKLLKQVKDDNNEISSMEWHIKELNEQISKANETVQQLDEDLEAAQSEKNQQYLELRKREEMMDKFLDQFHDAWEASLNRKTSLESDIVELLEKTSYNLKQCHQLPKMMDFHNLKDDLMFKETELEKAKTTAEGLLQQQQRLKTNLQKLDILEEKMTAELATLQEKIQKMKEELLIYDNIDALSSSMHAKEQELIAKKKVLELRHQDNTTVVSKLEEEYEALKNKLNENEAHIQLSNLERKWQHLEQNNFFIKEFIATKKAETNYEEDSKSVASLMADYNASLQAYYKR